MAIVSQTPSISEVKLALAETANSVGGLCTSPKINKWSRWKPVRHQKRADINETDLFNAKYGISLLEYSSVNSLISSMESGITPIWEYSKPRGGDFNEPYRLGDFRGYKDDAIPAIASMTVTDRVQKTGSNNTIQGTLLISDPSPGELGWNDLNLSGRKLGLAVKRGTNIYTAVANSESDSSVEINVNTENMPVGTYRGYLFLTNPLGTLSDVAGIDNHPHGGFPVEVIQTTMTLSIRAIWDNVNTNDVHIEIRTNNTTGNSINLLNSVLSVRFGMNDCDSALQQHEKSFSLGTLTSPSSPNEEIIYSDKVTVSRSESLSWKVCFRNTGTHPNNISSAILQTT